MHHIHFYHVRIFISFVTAVIHIKISNDSNENNGGYSIYHAKAYFPSFHLHMPWLTEWLQHFKCLVPHGWMWYDLCLWYSNSVLQNALCTHTHFLYNAISKYIFVDFKLHFYFQSHLCAYLA